MPASQYRLEKIGEPGDGRAGHGDSLLLVGVHERQERFGQPGQIPLGDRRLLAVGVAAVVIDGAEDGFRIIGIHESAGAVVDGLPASRPCCPCS